jgi:hypothetical protein
LGAGSFPDEGFWGFLTRFLGHTPSFRRFPRINHWDIEASWNQADCWASQIGPEYAQKEFDTPPVGPLNVLLGPDDEHGY